jgi:hypothetical protein
VSQLCSVLVDWVTMRASGYIADDFSTRLVGAFAGRVALMPRLENASTIGLDHGPGIRISAYVGAAPAGKSERRSVARA